MKNPLWAPGLETGYGSETFPALRAAAAQGDSELDAELAALIETVRELRAAWERHTSELE